METLSGTRLYVMNLETEYLGLKLKSPLVASASPLTQEVSNGKRLEDAGAAAIVMHSLFEEQVMIDSLRLNSELEAGTEAFGEALDYFPQMNDYGVGPDTHLDRLAAIKRSVDIPVIGSLNGVSVGGWTKFARLMEEEGVDALELNLYYIPKNPETSAGEIEEIYLDVIASVREVIKIPLAVKLSPFFSSLPHFARGAVEAGANGLVLFNRFYEPDFDLEALEVSPHLVLSNSNELRLPLRWIAILYGQNPGLDLALTSGVHHHEDVIKGLMAGAKVTMMTSELLLNGMGRIGEIERGLAEWMEEHEYESVKQMQGSMSRQNIEDPGTYERFNYLKVLGSYRAHKPEAWSAPS